MCAEMDIKGASLVHPLNQLLIAEGLSTPTQQIVSVTVSEQTRYKTLQ
jgi:hypothetical protein